MIYFDVTKTGSAGHRSGLMRVSGRLRDELGAQAASVVWKDGGWKKNDGGSVGFDSKDWLFTAELFSEAERPGFWRFLQERPCQLAATFNDAIPLRFPHITWPQSVARHPEYMKMLASFDRVLAISETSAMDLGDFWRWQGMSVRAAVSTILLGADFLRKERPVFSPDEAGMAKAMPSLLCVGILEPRKNQVFLLDVCASLWTEGLKFELNIVGRVNPHFGKLVNAALKTLRKKGYGVHHHEGIGDEEVLALYHRATASVFPTIAEGCGLPPLESLWMGVPCVCSDLPVLREHTGGGCVFAAVDDKAAWMNVLRRILTDLAWTAELRREAELRVLPTWAQTAQSVSAALTG